MYHVINWLRQWDVWIRLRCNLSALSTSILTLIILSMLVFNDGLKISTNIRWSSTINKSRVHWKNSVVLQLAIQFCCSVNLSFIAPVHLLKITKYFFVPLHTHKIALKISLPKSLRNIIIRAIIRAISWTTDVRFAHDYVVSY